MTTSRPRADWNDIGVRLRRAASATEEAMQTSPERAKKVLDARASALARRRIEMRRETETLSVVRFDLGNERYAVESRFLLGIVRVLDITAVPGIAPHLVGVTNVQGEILLLVDLRRLFGIAVKGLSDLSRIAVLGRERAELGLLADAVDDVATLPREAVLEAPPSLAEPGGGLLLGVLADARIVLDGSALLADPRLFAHSGAAPDRGLEVR